VWLLLEAFLCITFNWRGIELKSSLRVVGKEAPGPAQAYKGIPGQMYASKGSER
jgi:hypothetical protein